VRIFAAGAGPRLVVVPGIQGRWEWIRPALEALSAHCRVASYSLCGELGSGWRLDPSLGFDNYLRQLDDVTGEVGAPTALCGISYGGFIALRYAATRPERIRALVLVSAPSPGWVPTAIQRAYIERPWLNAPKFVLTSPFRMAPEIYAAFDSWPDRLGFSIAQVVRVARAPMIPGLMGGRIIEQQAMDFTPDAAAIRVPALVISGEPHLDRVVPVASTRRYAEMIAGARYVMLERTGHIGLVTRPEAFAALVGPFVRQSAAAADIVESWRPSAT
jgi:pimeloyl-ACP methyl ester carboxylesterase